MDKYQKIIDKKIEKYGFCNTILIRKIINNKHAILLQNAFPTLEKYIDHMHMINNMPAKVNDNLRDEILVNFKSLLNMKQHGTDLFFTDIDNLKEELLNEAKIKN